MSEIQKPWILEGYKVFAKQGPKGLKVEALAREVGKNKSSFYHHFADLEIFISFLLNYHLEQSRILAEAEKNAKDIHEIIDLIILHKQDLLFNRQLRIHREKKEFERCCQEVNAIIGESILKVWAHTLGLGEQSYLASLVLKLSLENFFLQITEETLNKEWLENYVRELKHMVDTFKSAQELEKR